MALYQRITREWRQQPAADMEERASLRLLKERFPIRYVVLHADVPEEYRRNLDATPRSFELLHTTASGDRVYRLRRGGAGPELRRAFRDDQMRRGPVVATVRGPAGARLLTALNDVPGESRALDGSPTRLELRAPAERIRRGLNVWALRLEGAPAGSVLELDALEWPGL